MISVSRSVELLAAGSGDNLHAVEHARVIRINRFPEGGQEEPVRAVLDIRFEPRLQEAADDARAIEEEADVHDRVRAVVHDGRDLGEEGRGARVVEDGLGLGAKLAERSGHEAGERVPVVVRAGDDGDARGAVADDFIGNDRRDRFVGRYGAEEVAGILLVVERRRGRRRRALRDPLVVQGLDKGLRDPRGSGPDDDVVPLSTQAVDRLDGRVWIRARIRHRQVDVPAGGVDIRHGELDSLDHGNAEGPERSRLGKDDAQVQLDGRHDRRFRGRGGGSGLRLGSDILVTTG